MFIELLIILTITYSGFLVKYLLNIPLPGVIVSMILMFILLSTGHLKTKKIEKVATFLLANMTILFLPAMVKIYNFMYLLQKDFLKIVFLLMITTITTMIITSKIVHLIIVRENKKRGESNGDAE